MKRTILVLALAVLSCAGCRAIGPGNAGCCAPVGPECGEPCGDQCCNGRGGNLANSGVCQGGGNAAFFGRYCGQDCSCNNGGCANGCSEGGCPLGCDCRSSGGGCGDGYHPGPYDCSACNSCNWGCSGHRHPNGYVTGNECYCQDPSRPPGPHFPGLHGQGYCAGCGQPAPGCCCANSGDQHYNFSPGPPVAQTAYPYYTLRGPRDFLLNNPPSIGPY